MKRSIVWFKTDLRLHDNETLVKAIAKSEEIIPVYCFDAAQFEITEYGFQKTGSFRAQFLLEAVSDLDKNLRELGSGLIILKGKPEVEIPKIVQEYNAYKVFAKREVTYEENQTEDLVESELFKLRCTNCEEFHRSSIPVARKAIILSTCSIGSVPHESTNSSKVGPSKYSITM